MANGEIAPFEQFLLLSQCFKKLSAAEASERVCVWEKGYETADMYCTFRYGYYDVEIGYLFTLRLFFYATVEQRQLSR